MAKLLKDYRFWGLICIIVVVFVIFMLLKFSGFNFKMEGFLEGGPTNFFKNFPTHPPACYTDKTYKTKVSATNAQVSSSACTANKSTNKWH